MATGWVTLEQEKFLLAQVCRPEVQNQDEDRSAFFWGLPSIEAGPGDPLLRPPECLCWGSIWVIDISPYLAGNSPSPGTTPQDAQWRPSLTPYTPAMGRPRPQAGSS